MMTENNWKEQVSLRLKGLDWSSILDDVRCDLLLIQVLI